MSQVNDFASAKVKITQSYAALLEALPGSHSAINGIIGSAVPPEQVSEFFELCYAYRDDLPGDLLEAAADVGHFAWINGFWGLGVDSRGLKMETILRGGSLPTGTDEPAPSGKYAPALGS